MLGDNVSKTNLISFLKYFNTDARATQFAKDLQQYGLLDDFAKDGKLLDNYKAIRSGDYNGFKNIAGYVKGLYPKYYNFVSGVGTWIDKIEMIVGNGARVKINNWISKGLNTTKTETAFASTTDKVILFNKLENAKSVYHQRTIVNDYLSIPGVTQGSFVSNAVNSISSNVVKTINGKEFVMYAGQAKTFVNNGALSIRSSIEIIEDLGIGIQFIKIKPGTKLYRVFDGYKPWDDITMAGNTLPNGSFWTFEKPAGITDVIEGTAVMPEWNGMSKIIEIEVPSTGLYGWYGKAARQPASSLSNNFYLKGNAEQIIINFGQNQQNVSSITKNITIAPWIN